MQAFTLLSNSFTARLSSFNRLQQYVGSLILIDNIIGLNKVLIFYGNLPSWGNGVNAFFVAVDANNDEFQDRSHKNIG